MSTQPSRSTTPTPPRWRRWLFGLEHASLVGERLMTRLVGSSRLNPLPHTGTIGILLLTVVVVTGIYLTLFFQFGFEASYRAVSGIENHPVQRIVRALHRYASVLLVINVLVHGWRTMVAARFTGARWLPWATGTVSLLLVWIAGVSGYWLIWDTRADHLNEALGRLLTTSRGLDFMIDFVWSSAAGSGWLFLLGLLTVHIVVTAVLGGALWLHVRRTRHRLLPPRHWMIIVLAPLLLVSIAWPTGMLDAAMLDRIPGSVPIDPTYLFLLPFAISWPPWAVAAVAIVAGALATALPLLVRSTTVDPVILDPHLCTGCEICVDDCPYDALSMGAGEHPVAVVDEARCVACGICVGSCSFDALALPGQTTSTVDVTGRSVAIACSRHVVHGLSELAGDVVVNEVTCAGMLHARTVAGLIERGAAHVNVIGCSPGDCSFGIGNQLAAERLDGDRAPFLGRRFHPAVDADWVSPLDLGEALAHPGRHSTAHADEVPPGRRGLVIASLVSLITTVVVVLATNLAWGTDPADAELLVVVDHAPGVALAGTEAVFDFPGETIDLVIMIDGMLLERRRLPPVQADQEETALHRLTYPVTAGTHDVVVALESDSEIVELVAGTYSLAPGRRLVVEALDTVGGSPVQAGEDLFFESSLGTNVGCQICHSTRPGDDGVGPSLWDIGRQAQSRVAGLDADAYLRQSILDPDAYVVAGFPAGQMVPDYGDRLSMDQLDALVAYLLSLQGDA